MHVWFIPRRWVAPCLGVIFGVLLASTAHAIPFTTTSPIDGGTPLPSGVTEVGGIVFHAQGLNGAILTSQLPASALFAGYFDIDDPAAFRGNPGTIGIQSGFTPALLNQLGGGFREAAVRITLFDGDSAPDNSGFSFPTGVRLDELFDGDAAPGNFDANDNFLLLNGINFGAASDFTGVTTQTTNSTGTAPFDSLDMGFPHEQFNTGFFHFTDPQLLASLFASLEATGELRFQLLDDDPFDNRFRFRRGLDQALRGVGFAPQVTAPVPEPGSLLVWGMLASLGVAFACRRRGRRAEPEAKILRSACA